MKVWLLCYTNWDDFIIEKVFDSQSKADKEKSYYSKEEQRHYSVEEYEVE